MSGSIARLHARREVLIAESARQRQQLAVVYADCEHAFRVPDALFRVATTVRQHPWLAGLVTAGAGWLGWRRVTAMPGRVFQLWQGARWAYGLWQRYR